MENKRKRGRPKKNNPIKVGTLQKGYCRFTFIAETEKVEKIKKISKKESLPIKELMSIIFENVFTKDGLKHLSKQINSKKIKQREYSILLEYVKEDMNFRTIKKRG